jgi:predicted transcriptional regulator
MFLRKECSKCVIEIKDFANRRLNEKEKIILEEAAKNNTNVTKLVSHISKAHGFSKTSVWYNLKKLKEDGLLIFGDCDKKGINVKLTLLGSIIQNNGRCKKCP